MNIVTQTVDWLLDPANWVGPNGIPARLLEHIAISVTAMLVATLIALPIGLYIGHTGRGAVRAVNLANLGRALPSLAVIGIVLPITVAIDPDYGFKVLPTLVAMIVLAIPPILVNAYAGVAAVDRDLVEAGRGMGLRGSDVVRRIEIPVAIPVIFGGLRSASVQVIATATLGAIFGFGGLGRFLVDGVAQNDDGMLFGGVVLVAGLALSADAGLAVLQRVLTSPGLRLAGSAREKRREPATGRM